MMAIETGYDIRYNIGTKTDRAVRIRYEERGALWTS